MIWFFVCDLLAGVSLSKRKRYIVPSPPHSVTTQYDRAPRNSSNGQDRHDLKKAVSSSPSNSQNANRDVSASYLTSSNTRVSTWAHTPTTRVPRRSSNAEDLQQYTSPVSESPSTRTPNCSSFRKLVKCSRWSAIYECNF